MNVKKTLHVENSTHRNIDMSENIVITHEVGENKTREMRLFLWNKHLM